jgi:hypothetical protein
MVGFLQVFQFPPAIYGIAREVSNVMMFIAIFSQSVNYDYCIKYLFL